MADTTAPVPFSLSISGTTGTLTWTETDSPPVLNATPTSGYPPYVKTGNAGNPNMSGQTYQLAGIDGAGYKFYSDTATGTNNYLKWDASFSAFSFDQSSVSSSDTNSSTSQVFYYSNGGQTLASGPIGSCAVGGLGTAPAPTITGSFGPSQGLSFSTSSGTAGQLSGGAVTISNVVTNGTTTTFTTSRAIASTETGNLLGAVGAFSDSASPANTTAAFSVPIAFSAAVGPPQNLTVVIVY